MEYILPSPPPPPGRPEGREVYYGQATGLIPVCGNTFSRTEERELRKAFNLQCAAKENKTY